MATEKQVLANQQNAKHSTGPRTEAGKRRSRRNAIRHGLRAETVIDTLEDAADCRAFERAIKSDYSPQTAIEGQLVSRLASLLWRLRRAVIVESGLLNMQFQTLVRYRNLPWIGAAKRHGMSCAGKLRRALFARKLTLA
jgi:hypothetical protein